MGNPKVPATHIGMVMGTKLHLYIGISFFMGAKFFNGYRYGWEIPTEHKPIAIPNSKG